MSSISYPSEVVFEPWLEIFLSHWPDWPVFQIPTEHEALFSTPPCPFNDVPNIVWRLLWRTYQEAWFMKMQLLSDQMPYDQANLVFTYTYDTYETRSRVFAEQLSKAHSWYKHLRPLGETLYLTYDSTSQHVPFSLWWNDLPPAGLPKVPIQLNCFFRGIDVMCGVEEEHPMGDYIVLSSYFRGSRTTLIHKAKHYIEFHDITKKDECIRHIWRHEQARQVREIVTQLRKLRTCKNTSDIRHRRQSCSWVHAPSTTVAPDLKSKFLGPYLGVTKDTPVMDGLKLLAKNIVDTAPPEESNKTRDAWKAIYGLLSKNLKATH